MAKLFYRIKLLFDRFGAEALKLETRKQVYATESEVKQRYWTGNEEIDLKDIKELKISYWVGQKVHSDFSITSYRKTQMNFLANPAYPLGPAKIKSLVISSFLLYHHYSIIVTHLN